MRWHWQAQAEARERVRANEGVQRQRKAGRRWEMSAGIRVAVTTPKNHGQREPARMMPCTGCWYLNASETAR